AAPPLAGIFGMPLPRFLLFDSLGALLYAGMFTGLGYLFSAELERMAEGALRLGEWLVLVLAGALAISVLGTSWQRRRFLLHRRGITRVRPLLGGLDAWRAHQYPLQEHRPPTA